MTTYTNVHVREADEIRGKMAGGTPVLVIAQQYGSDLRLFIGNDDAVRGTEVGIIDRMIAALTALRKSLPEPVKA